MRAEATVRLRFHSAKQMETAVQSLKPETKAPSAKRAKITITKQGNCLTLKVKAQDTVALRASLNAYLRWITSLLNVFETVESW